MEEEEKGERAASRGQSAGEVSAWGGVWEAWGGCLRVLKGGVVQAARCVYLRVCCRWRCPLCSTCRLCRQAWGHLRQHPLHTGARALASALTTPKRPPHAGSDAAAERAGEDLGQEDSDDSEGVEDEQDKAFIDDAGGEGGSAAGLGVGVAGAR